jgi:hypothetical protein
MSALPELYETDFYAWTRLQVRELRRLDARSLNVEVDLRHLIEEVWGVGSSQRDTCYSQTVRVLEHLLKLSASPAEGPRAGWQRSIVDARGVLEDKLTSTLDRKTRRQLPRLYRRARKLAALGLREYGEHKAAERLPATCPYTMDDVLREDWYPEPEQGRG